MPATTTEKYWFFFFFIIFAYWQRQICAVVLRQWFNDRTECDLSTAICMIRIEKRWNRWQSAFQVNAIFALFKAITFVWNQWSLIGNNSTYVIITILSARIAPRIVIIDADTHSSIELWIYELFKQFPKANWILRLIAATNLPSIKRNDCEEVRQHFLRLGLESKLISLR